MTEESVVISDESESKEYKHSQARGMQTLFEAAAKHRQERAAAHYQWHSTGREIHIPPPAAISTAGFRQELGVTTQSSATAEVEAPSVPVEVDNNGIHIDLNKKTDYYVCSVRNSMHIYLRVMTMPGNCGALLLFDVFTHIKKNPNKDELLKVLRKFFRERSEALIVFTDMKSYGRVEELVSELTNDNYTVNESVRNDNSNNLIRSGYFLRSDIAGD